MTARTEQLERETERARTDLAVSLEELRSRMTVGQLVDQVLHPTGDSEPAALVRNLRRQVVDNPLALGLVGLGLGWLMLPSPRRGNGRDDGTAVADAARAGWNRVSEAGQTVRDRVGQAGETLSDAAQSLQEGASRASGAAVDAAAQVRDKVSAFGRGTADALDGAGHGLARLVREQPLILAGLGLAIGAALGAALPETETEDALMGKSSDAFKGEAEDVVGEQAERVKQATERVVDEVKEVVRDELDALDTTAAATPPPETSGPSIAPTVEESEHDIPVSADPGDRRS